MHVSLFRKYHQRICDESLYFTFRDISIKMPIIPTASSVTGLNAK